MRRSQEVTLGDEQTFNLSARSSTHCSQLLPIEATATMAAQEQSASNVGGAIFQDGTTFDMKSQVVAIHEHFDADGDGYLNYKELSSLQLITSGADMTQEQYKHVCTMLDCHPDKGLSLDALRLTYAAEGTNVEDDFKKVFPKGKVPAKPSGVSKAKKDDNDEDDDVIEVGEGGVDVSS